MRGNGFNLRSIGYRAFPIETTRHPSGLCRRQWVSLLHPSATVAQLIGVASSAIVFDADPSKDRVHPFGFKAISIGFIRKPLRSNGPQKVCSENNGFQLKPIGIGM